MHRIGLVLASEKRQDVPVTRWLDAISPLAACHPIVVLGHSVYVVIAVCVPAWFFLPCPICFGCSQSLVRCVETDLVHSGFRLWTWSPVQLVSHEVIAVDALRLLLW